MNIIFLYSKMSETDPLIERNDDDDDDDDEEEVNPFRPDSSSIPGPSGEDIPLTTMNREREKEPTSFKFQVSSFKFQVSSLLRLPKELVTMNTACNNRRNIFH